MRTLLAFLALIALAFAYPGGHGGGDEGKATQVIHGEPIITRVFKSPGLGYFNNYAPKIDGPLEKKGYGPHIFGNKEH